MIIHIGTEVNMLFGVLKDGNVVEKVPYKVELQEFTPETLQKLGEVFSQLKSELQKKVEESGLPNQAENNL